MASLALTMTMVPGRSTTRGVLQRRWTHKSTSSLYGGGGQKQAIIMPAISPLMMEAKVTRWKVREGQSFVPGDVLLQIENEIAIVDVEANNAGILGKILIPDGTEHVPIQQILALVARDETELSQLRLQAQLEEDLPIPSRTSTAFRNSSPSSPNFEFSTSTITTPDSPSFSINATTTRRRDVPVAGHSHSHTQMPLALNPPKSPIASAIRTSTRRPSLYEMQTMGFGHRTIGSGAVAAVDSRREGSTTPMEMEMEMEMGESPQEVPFADGASIRRMIVTNLTRTSRRSSRVADEAIF